MALVEGLKVRIDGRKPQTQAGESGTRSKHRLVTFFHQLSPNDSLIKENKKPFLNMETINKL